jgi:hypothetical protein
MIWAEGKAGRMNEQHSEKLHNLYSSLNMISAFKSWMIK